MSMRKLAEDIEQQKHFEAAPAPSPEKDEGTRDMGPLYPFLISGGTNTERYYFTHVNDTTDYKFNIKPEYFGNESCYPEVFFERIRDILKKNIGAKVFCVFDLDTIFCNKKNQDRHKNFVENILQDNFYQKLIQNILIQIVPQLICVLFLIYLYFIHYLIR